MSANDINTNLTSYGRLYPSQEINTADGNYKMILQSDGNLVLYSPNNAIWASGTDGRAVGYLALQTDGNLVLYDKTDRPLWNSNTPGRGSVKLVLQQDGNLVIYSFTNFPYWNTGTMGRF